MKKKKAKAFIASSTESLEIAYAIQENLEYDVESTVWSQGVFEISLTSLESLLITFDEMDFGIFVFSPDDVIKLRNKEMMTVRDNVVFELGLFIGKLGKTRNFIVIPRDEELHLPTDILGMTAGSYDPNRRDENMTAALGPVCNKIKKQVKKLGYFHEHSRSGGLLEIDEDIKIDQGKENFELVFSYGLFQTSFIPTKRPRVNPWYEGREEESLYERRSERIVLDLNSLFYQIASLMLIEALEEEIQSKIREFLLDHDKMQKICSLNGQYKIKIMEIENFQKILEKFYDFGWIEISEKQRHKHDFRRYWKLKDDGHEARKKLSLKSNEQILKEGDVVELYSGGPIMTVLGCIGEGKRNVIEKVFKANGFCDGDIICQWFETGDLKPKMNAFPKHSLKRGSANNHRH